VEEPPERHELASLGGGDVRLDAQIDGEDGTALVALLGLDKLVAVGKQPGFVNVLATGKPDDLMKVEGRIVAGALDAKTAGTLRVAGDQGVSADLQLDIAKADVRPLGGIAHRIDPLPLTLHGWLALSDQSAKLDRVTATLGGTELRGAMRLGFGAPPRVSGEIEADSLDAAAVIAAAVGVPPSLVAKRGVAGGWSAEPYGPGQFGDLEGSVDLKVMRAALTPSLPARQVQTTIVFHGSEIALNKFEAHVAGGQLTGKLSFRRSKDGLATHAVIDAKGLDAAAVLPSDARPVIGGRLSGKLDLEASGLSPRALVGSLAGTGTINLDEGYFSSLDPKAFDTIIRASDQGLAVAPPKIHSLVTAALDSGRLRIPQIETTFTINAGQLRLANATAHADGADLVATGSLDLTQQQMDARLTLTGPARSDGSSGRPDIFIGLKGPVANPQRTIDVSALAGWLTIRRIDQEAKKLEALEKARLESRANAQKPAPVVVPPIAEPPTSALTPPMPAPATPAPSASIAPPTAPAMRDVPTRDGGTREEGGGRAAPAPHAAPTHPVPTHPAPAHTATKPATPSEPRTSMAAPPLQLAPALPAPVEVKRIPRAPSEHSSSNAARPQPRTGQPLWLPSAQPPSVMDSLIGAGQQR
jgi:large subunit ribosomal protein L24